jgi:hypothetical protein
MPLDGLSYEALAEKHGFIPADHAAPKFFPVKARRLFDEAGHELPGYLRIVREDTGDTLHVATDSYKVVTNEEAFGAFEDALKASTLDLTDMRIGTDYAANGARCFRQYLLPAHRVEVKNGIEVALRLIMMNSYDGSLKFRGQCGAYNFVCANTSVSGTDYAQFSMRHSGGIDVKQAIAGLTKAAEEHLETTRRWRAWPRIPVSDQQALEVCKAMPLATPGLVDHLVHSWLRARDEGGPQSGANLWCLWNVLTAWATHGDLHVRGGTGQAKFDRERRVARLTESKPWQALAGAAS